MCSCFNTASGTGRKPLEFELNISKVLATATIFRAKLE